MNAKRPVYGPCFARLLNSNGSVWRSTFTRRSSVRLKKQIKKYSYMSIAQTNIAKIAAVVAGLGLVAMSFAAAAPARAASTDVAAQIAALQAQLAALMAQAGGSASASFTMDLTIGSKGTEVTALQNWLISKGYSIPAGATGYFGAQTKAAVAAWQAAAGITPAAGYFGPKSRAAANASAGGSTGGTTGTSGLTGGAGKLKNVDMLGDIESDLDEGDAATQVIGFEAEAQDSDVAVQRLDVKFTIANSGGSASLNKYIDTVAVYQDGKKLGSMSASAGDKDGRVWTFRFADLNGVIREGKTSSFYVKVTPVTSIGSDEDGDSITANIPTDGVRAVDAEGVSETYTPSGTTSQSFTVSTATNGTLSINEGSDNPKATTVKADINDTTENITLTSFNLKAKNQDVTVHDLPVGLNSNAVKISEYIQSVKLMKGNTVLKTKTLSSTNASYEEVVFDNIDQTISKDSSTNFTVVVNVRKIDSGNSFNGGDYLYATTSSVSNSWDVEDEDGGTVNPTGSLTGNNISFQATGITVAKTDASYNKTVGQNAGEGDKTQYSLSFKVTAGDDDLYISRTITRLATTGTATTNNGGIQWATTTSSTQGGTSMATPGIATNFAVGDTNSGDTASNYKIPSGTTRTFTLNVTLTATTTGFTGVQLVGISYGTTTSMGAVYASGLDTYKTADVSMTTH